MYKIIVTGGLGFIGSNLIKLLLKKNIKFLISIKQVMHQAFIILKNLEIINIINLLKMTYQIQKKYLK